MGGSVYDHHRLDWKDGGVVLVRLDRHIARAGELDFASDLEIFTCSIFQTADKA